MSAPLNAMDKEIKKAAMAFAKAWAAWHEHGGVTLDPELVDAGHGIVEALGLEMVETSKGKQKLVRKK